MRHHTTSALDAPHGPITLLCLLLKEGTARFERSYLLSSHSCVWFAVKCAVYSFQITGTDAATFVRGSRSRSWISSSHIRRRGQSGAVMRMRRQWPRPLCLITRKHARRGRKRLNMTDYGHPSTKCWIAGSTYRKLKRVYVVNVCNYQSKHPHTIFKGTWKRLPNLDFK